MLDNLNNSRRNRTDLIANTQVAKDLIRDLFESYLETREDRKKRKLSEGQKLTYRRHMEMVICDLLAAWDADPEKYIGYSRGKKNFIKGGSYWSYKRNRSIPASAILLEIVGFLEDFYFIENRVAPSGESELSSRMRATNQLGDIFYRHNLNSFHIGHDPEDDVIVVKDGDKNTVRLEAAKGHETIDLERAEENLRRINENLRTTFININLTDCEFAALRNRLRGNEGGEDREAFEPANRSLRRIFSNGSFEFGGRFYGGWWQGIPGELRRYIEIDGAITREIDYSSMQASLLYALVDEEPLEDAYSVKGWPDEVRPYAKKAFNQLLNSNKVKRNPNQWHVFAPDIDPNPLPDDWPLLKIHQRHQIKHREFERIFGRPYFDLLHELKELHRPIDHYFFTNAWGMVQRLDSDIAEEVMIRLFSAEFPVMALPIHDSFIVRRAGERILERTMKEVFEETMGVECNVKLCEAVYDPVNGQDRTRLINMAELFDEFERDLKERSTYHTREYEWISVHGPL